MDSLKVNGFSQLPLAEETLNRMYDEWVLFQTSGIVVPDEEHCSAVVFMVQEFRQIIKDLKAKNDVEPLKKVV